MAGDPERRAGRLGREYATGSVVGSGFVAVAYGSEG
jgi:hypothetical protein